MAKPPRQWLIDEILDGDRLLTTPEAAEILGIEPGTLKRRAEIPRISPGGGPLRWRASVIYAEREAAQTRTHHRPRPGS